LYLEAVVARYFNLVVQCGRDKEEAEQMEEYFRNVVLQFESGLTTHCRCYTQEDSQGCWWICATPLRANYGSCIEGDSYLLTDQNQYNELRNLLSQNLLAAPTFRCATAYWEMQEFYDDNPAFDNDDFTCLDILCEQLWNQLQRPAEFSFFKEGYVIKADLPRLF
jgi:hypothetical protein